MYGVVGIIGGREERSKGDGVEAWPNCLLIASSNGRLRDKRRNSRLDPDASKSRCEASERVRSGTAGVVKQLVAESTGRK